VLEAMACGAPVVTSAAVNLPNLAKVARLCDPLDPASIAAQIDELLSDNILRGTLARAGAEYARPYTWKRTAEMTLRVYAEAAGERR